MNISALLLRTVITDPHITQRNLSKILGISLGNTNKHIKQMITDGYIILNKGYYSLTENGKNYLNKFRVNNAVIIAAGFGSRFVPLTYETPKGLLEVFGERMIERQIQQLHKAGIYDITIMVGYLKEKFEYLIDKYQVELLYNPEYSTKNTLTTLYHARHLLKNTYILASDNWLRDNLYHAYEPCAWYSSVFMKGNTSEWCLKSDKKNKITEITIGGKDSYVMYGPAYFDETFSQTFVSLLEQNYNRPGTENNYWEHVLLDNLDCLDIYLNPQSSDCVYEFENLEELRMFDQKYQTNSNNDAMKCISKIFSVSESQITNIQCLKAGMTNKSFLFSVNGAEYIFRIPGPGTDKLINRKEEKSSYEAVKHLNISDEIIYFDGVTGYKISKYYRGSSHCNAQNKEEVKKCMHLLRSFHQSGTSVDHEFSLREHIDFYESLCMGNNGIQFEDYSETRNKMNELLDLLDQMNLPKTLSHIDSVETNFLILPDQSIRLIDWEYAGMCDPLIDIAMFAIYSYYTDSQIDQLISIYFDRKGSKEEYIRIYAYVALGGFLWALWAEYKSSLGEEFGEYTIKMYRYGKNYYKKIKQICSEMVLIEES